MTTRKDKMDCVLTDLNAVLRMNAYSFETKKSIKPFGFSSDFMEIVSDEDVNELWIYREKRRLGFYFEALVKVLLEHDKWMINKSNYQKIEDGITKGELDFLMEKENVKKHLEVALKFYLSNEGEWLGPNARDSFSRKINSTIKCTEWVNKDFKNYTTEVFMPVFFYEHYSKAKDGANLWCRKKEVTKVLQKICPKNIWMHEKPDWISFQSGIGVSCDQLVSFEINRNIQFQLETETRKQKWIIVEDQWPNL